MRGLCLLLIALVNIQAFAYSAYSYPRWAISSASSEAIGFLNFALIQGKIYLLFSFVFGYSLALTCRASSIDEQDIRRMKRRMVVLGILGLLHGTFLFFGDILATYALIGWLFVRGLENSRKRSTEGNPDYQLIKRAVGFFLLSIALTIAIVGPLTLLVPTADKSQPIVELIQISRAAYTDTLVYRASLWFVTLLGVLVLGIGPIILMMTLGWLAQRRLWLSKDSVKSQLMGRIGQFVWFPALLVSLLFAYETMQVGPDQFPLSAWDSLLFNVHAFIAPILSLSYLAWLLRFYWLELPAVQRVFSYFGTAGKMSLSIYLLQSLIFATIFSHWGLDKFDQLEAWQLALISITTWISLTAIAYLWLLGFKRGPIETIVHQLTNRNLDQQKQGSNTKPDE